MTISARRVALLGIGFPLSPIMLAVLGLWPEEEEQFFFGGGSYATPKYSVPAERKKRRYAVRLGGKLMIFGSQAAAMQAIDAEESRKPPEIVEVKIETEDDATEQIDLPSVKTYAKAQGLVKQYNEAYNSLHYQALIAMFEQMRDEDDVELLLMVA